MGTDNLFWKKKSRLERLKDVRDRRPTILIVCEGKKTEPNYFKAFRVTTVAVEIAGLGADPKKLVEYALSRRKERDYDQVWCVFDRDNVQKVRFNAALDKAEKSDIKVAYSNEAFELWYVLHFEYLNSGISRSQYCAKLNVLLGKKYVKNDENMYSTLFNSQSVALRNAKNLLNNYNPITPVDDNPSTTVHLLVQELNKYSN